MTDRLGYVGGREGEEIEDTGLLSYPKKGKITPQLREEIGKRYVAGEKAADLALEFGVSAQYIHKYFTRNPRH